MPQKGKTKPEKMSERPPVRFTPTEMAAIRERALNANLPVATYIHAAALSRDTPSRGIPGVDPGTIAEAIGRLNSIGSELHTLSFELARQASAGDTPAASKVNHVLDRIMDITERLVKALGFGG